MPAPRRSRKMTAQFMQARKLCGYPANASGFQQMTALFQECCTRLRDGDEQGIVEWFATRRGTRNTTDKINAEVRAAVLPLMHEFMAKAAGKSG
jgi:hypothetical protein